jgi:hypothetical protein
MAKRRHKWQAGIARKALKSTPRAMTRIGVTTGFFTRL